MAKCRIGTAKFFTLLLLLYRTLVNLTGIFCLASAIYGLYLYIKLPPKEDVMGSGKKAILK